MITPTTKLGDTIHRYAVLRHVSAQPTVQARYVSLFPTNSVLGVSTADWPITVRPFQGPAHATHIRDTLAWCYGVEGADLRGPIQSRARVRHRPYVTLFPHAAEAVKEWRDERWNALADRLMSEGYHVICCPGLNRGDPIYPLPQMATLIAKASLVIGVDSGHLHLADAYAVPTIGLYGATSAVTYGPYTQRHLCVDVHQAQWSHKAPYDSSVYLPASAMDAITVEDVLQKVHQVTGITF